MFFSHITTDVRSITLKLFQNHFSDIANVSENTQAIRELQ